MHGLGDVRQTEIQTVELLVPKPNAFDVEMANEKLKRHKNPVIDQIPEEIIKAEGGTIRSGIHTLINSIWNKEELPEEWEGVDHRTYW
jgi:uncharacterized protein (DUF305 family)